MEDDNKLSYFFLGLGLGVAAGLLFAPKSGEETRTLLKSKAEEGRDFLKQRGGDLRESAGEAVERGKSALAKQKDQLTAAMEAGKQAYRETMRTAQGEEPEGA